MEVPLTPLSFAERGFLWHAERPAILDDGLLLTYADLEQRVTRLASGLRGLGVARGDRVALLAPNTLPALEAYTGVPLAGAILVPLNIRLAKDDYVYILDHSGATVLLADPSLVELVEPIIAERPAVRLVVYGDPPAGSLSYEELLASAKPLPFTSGDIDERDPITLNYTSGTTARPKGVLISHRAAFLNAVNMVLAFHLRREDIHLHVAPMFHANGWGFVWATLGVGAANVPLPKVRGADIFRRIEKFGVTTLCAAPTVLRSILREAQESAPPPAGLRVGTAGGAPPAATIRRLEEELGWDVIHMYGLTETTAFLTHCEEPEGLASRPIAERAVFKARQGIPFLTAGNVRVVDESGNDVPRDGDTAGEVIARGNVIMNGYHRDREATNQALEGGWFHTGDLAVRHPDGYIEIRDRLKDVIRSGGEQIPSVQVEGVLAGHPAVAEVAVVAAPHPEWGETPVAFIVPRIGMAPTPADLAEFCRVRLAHFKVPRQFVLITDLPRTASGKIRKEVLRRQVRDMAPEG